jgi:hypothetical protein
LEELAELSNEVLESALASGRRRTEELDCQVSELLEKRGAIEHEVRLIEQLLAVRNGKVEVGRLSHTLANASDPDTERGRRRRRSPPMHPSVAAAIEELERAGKPLHISELMAALDDRDVTLPGSGQQANLIAHLTRRSEIVRPRRGMYGLAVWGLTDMPLKPAKRQRRRAKRRTTSSGKTRS